jgi:hypothetical protein
MYSIPPRDMRHGDPQIGMHISTWLQQSSIASLDRWSRLTVVLSQSVDIFFSFHSLIYQGTTATLLIPLLSLLYIYFKCLGNTYYHASLGICGNSLRDMQHRDPQIGYAHDSNTHLG